MMTKRQISVARSVLALLFMLVAQAPHTHAQAAANAVPILILGDSLSAEYGLPRGSGWVTEMGKSLSAQKWTVQLQNASISGETTSGAVSRIDQLLRQHKPKIVVIELGGNDALRGLPIVKTQENLTALITRSQRSGAKVALVGIRIPPNYGRSYTEDFANLFPSLAKQHKTALVPFIFSGLADTNEYFQPDRIHPTVKSQPIIAANITPVVEQLLRQK
jgi:acyl-CoA thioesterase I